MEQLATKSELAKANWAVKLILDGSRYHHISFIKKSRVKISELEDFQVTATTITSRTALLFELLKQQRP
jgi:hypothetical protein